MTVLRSIPAPAEALLGSSALAHVVTRNRDGTPQVSVVWCGVRGDRILFCTEGNTAKVRNLRRDPDVVLSIQRGKDSVDAEAVYVHPAFALTPVAANKSFISMEGLYLLGFGPRTAAAARDLSIKLYPRLAPQTEKFTPAAVTANCRL